MPNPEESLSQLGLIFPEAPANLRRVWRVGQLVGEVRNHIEREYADVWVEGEVSNYRAAPSGHVYFTLKDGEAQLPVVLFRRQAMLLRFRLEDGLQILVRGRVSVYEQRGQMQLVAEFVEPVGAGSLQIAFEQLKARLQKEGLFDADRKQQLARLPPLHRHHYLAHRRGHSRLSQCRRAQAPGTQRADLPVGGARRDGGS